MNRFPDFLIVGAQKCGTGALYHWLRACPGCYLPEIKEPHYFARFEPWDGLRRSGSVVRDTSEYQNLFSAAGQGQLCGEASPSYLYEEGVARRIRKTVPACKILILVRDPVERAYSEYLMNVVAGFEHRSFDGAVEDAIFGRARKSWADFPLYCELSKYGTQIARYFETFPKSQILVLTSHELASYSLRTMQRISSFLGIDQDYWDEFKFTKHHVGREPRNRWMRALLTSSAARAVGRLLVPPDWRPFVGRYVMSKEPKEKHISMRAKELVWSACEDEIRLLESLLGEHLPELWGTFPNGHKGLSDGSLLGPMSH